MKITARVFEELLKAASIIFWYLVFTGLRGAIVDYAQPKFKKGDIVWAYNVDPDTYPQTARIKGKLVRFYRFGGDVHWSVQDLKSKFGSCSEYKEQWIRPFEQETQGVTEGQTSVQ